MAGHGQKAIYAALFANAGIAVAKFAGFVVTGSSSMLSESIHSVADSGNQSLLLLGGSRSRREATPTHPFGYGRERYFWSFVVALVLFSLGSLFSLYEGFHKLGDPHPLDSPEWAIGILLFAIVLESFSMRTAVGESNKVRGDASWAQFIRRSKIPELPVVLLEDLGALVGLVLAFAAVVASAATGDGIYDAYGTLAIGTLLGIIAIVLAVEMKSLLIGEGASPADEEAVRKAIESAPEVVRVLHMRTEHLGPEELLVAAKVEFEPDLSIAQLADVVNAVEQQVRATVKVVGPMYLEPDVFRKDQADDEAATTTWQEALEDADQPAESP
jgi:cation diffusion facilitator family transporter